MAKSKQVELEVPEPDIAKAAFRIRGNAPLVMHAFSKEELDKMLATHMQGDAAKGKKKREPKDPDKLFLQSQHKSPEGWEGIPATAFKSGMVDACRLTGVKMTYARLSIYVLADGYDAEDTSMPLVRITKGKPHPVINRVTIGQRKPDVRIRAMWDPGWEAVVRMKWFNNQMEAQSVLNLLSHLGITGIMEGRVKPDSSCGMGWGTFEVISG